MQVLGGVDLRLSMKKQKTLHHRVPSDEALMTATRKFASQSQKHTPPPLQAMSGPAPAASAQQLHVQQQQQQRSSPLAPPPPAVPAPPVTPSQPSRRPSTAEASRKPSREGSEGSEAEAAAALAAVKATKAKGLLIPGVDVVGSCYLHELLLSNSQPTCD